jgi:ABC-type branched-subunit amino acid transport system ATPase component
MPLSIADRGYVLKTGRIVLADRYLGAASQRRPEEGIPWPLRL